MYTFWEYSFACTDTHSSGEYPTKEEALAAATEEWEYICESMYEVPSNGSIIEDTVALLEIDEHENVLQCIWEDVYYEYYHGDFKEHFNQGDYL